MDFTSRPSSRQYSGTIAAYDMYASTSGSATFARPSCSSASDVGSAVTGTSAVVVTGAVSLPVALAAAKKAGVPSERVIVFDAVEGANNTTVHTLIEEGLAQPQQFVERRLAPGEGKKKLAFLSFSSGTKGRPKVRYQWMVQAQGSVRELNTSPLCRR